ncbi:MAG: NAD(P)H-binding protein [Flavobacteriales bacterium]|nr:NAD(P)H-binding protein [Flavobacteriales bacterium]
MSTSLLLAGATGLVGSSVLEQALAEPHVERVIVVGRRPLPEHPKLEQWVRADLQEALRPQRADAVICCLGTTIRNVGGDRNKFIHVDKDLVLSLGRWAKEQGVASMAVVSAIGADARSGIFYNRVKGETEDDLRALDLSALHLFQPSILTGPRNEKRPGERAGILVAELLAPLMVGGLRKYRPMPHERLARALLYAARSGASGVHVHTYDAIMGMAAQNTTR